ncbi:MAG: PilX N-terminal domain-containing pilus assembly protein [Myxococcaceae bacterium]
MARHFFQNGERGRPSRGVRRKNERGVALIIAVISIAILTAVATEFLYTSRVDMQMAANQRDDTRAYYMARSGIGLARMMLSFQKQLDSIQLPPGLAELLGGGGLGALTGGGTGKTGGVTTPTPTGLNIELWKLARVDCYMLQGLVDTSGEGLDSDDIGRRPDSEDPTVDPDTGEISAPGGQRDFGGFNGCFDVKIEAENTKINLNGLGVPNGSFYRALALLSEKKFEYLFDEPDANRVETSPQDLIMAFQDWVDEDKAGSAIDLSGASLSPLRPGFSDENMGYSRYQPEYEAKNALFDSLDEVYMVHGINDRIMAAFRDRFTVYPDWNKPANINSEDPLLLVAAIQAIARNPADGRLQDPVFMSQVLKSIQTAKAFSFFGFSAKDFVAIVQAHGIEVNPQASTGSSPIITDKNDTFTLKSTGEAGAIKKTITAVVRMDQGPMGRLVYWREE